ncbi:MAG: GTPase ObgE [Thermaerobacterales bacterium]
MATFIDRARIYVQAGSGGSGISSFHRAKYVPLGGPDGGDGGRGGDAVFVVDPSRNTLIDFRYRRHFKAESGRHGEGSKRRGKQGKTLEIPVPPGTVVKSEDGEILADLTEAGDHYTVARGGRGGRGNARFVSSTNRAPRLAEKGEPGPEFWVLLELKLLADVGLVGLPNAGKSTLLSRMSAARPKVAAYPFTTLEPQLGVIRLPDGHSYVMADIPGLIEGAHQGVGLGHEFLRHIERTRVLLFVLDAAGTEGRNPIDDYFTLRAELHQYADRLTRLPRLVALNKLDLPDGRERRAALEKALTAEGDQVVGISAATGAGLDQLSGQLRRLLDSAAKEPAAATPPRRVYRPGRQEQPFRIEHRDGLFLVKGAVVERWVAMTDMDNEEGLVYLQRRMQRIRLDEALRSAGAKTGDSVRVGEFEFTFEDPADD